MWTGRDLEGDSPGLIEVLCRDFPGEAEKTTNDVIRTTGVPVENRIENLVQSLTATLTRSVTKCNVEEILAESSLRFWGTCCLYLQGRKASGTTKRVYRWKLKELLSDQWKTVVGPEEVGHNIWGQTRRGRNLSLTSVHSLLLYSAPPTFTCSPSLHLNSRFHVHNQSSNLKTEAENSPENSVTFTHTTVPHPRRRNLDDNV
jgi:hypothetical protein